LPGSAPRTQHHAWAERVFDQLPTGPLVREAVLAEACHLVAKDGVAPAKVLQLVEGHGLTLVSLADQVPHIRKLLTRYVDVPVDFADACVVRLAEIHPNHVVCTVDGHFRFSRKNGLEIVSLLAPFAS